MDLFSPTAVFWDYENVPLRRRYRKRFLNSIDNMKESIEVEFFRIYSTRIGLPERDRQILASRGYRRYNFKYVTQDGPNASDISLMTSAVSVVSTRPHIKQILLITGDGDFLELTRKLPEQRIVVICQRNNYNKKLTDTVDEAYSVSFVAKNPSWFIGL